MTPIEKNVQFIITIKSTNSRIVGLKIIKNDQQLPVINTKLICNYWFKLIDNSHDIKKVLVFVFFCRLKQEYSNI